MDTGYVELPVDAAVSDAMAELQKHEEILEDLHNIFLVDEERRLKYTVPLARLFFASGDTLLKGLAADPLLYAYSNEKQDRVAEIFDKYNLLALPVLDQHDRLIGVITVDDVVALLRQE